MRPGRKVGNRLGSFNGHGHRLAGLRTRRTPRSDCRCVPPAAPDATRTTLARSATPVSHAEPPIYELGGVLSVIHGYCDDQRDNVR